MKFFGNESLVTRRVYRICHRLNISTGGGDPGRSHAILPVINNEILGGMKGQAPLREGGRRKDRSEVTVSETSGKPRDAQRLASPRPERGEGFLALMISSVC